MNILATIVAVAILLFLTDKLYVRFWDRKLDIDVNFSQKEAFVGDKLNLVETVVNQKFLPLPLLLLKFNTSKHLAFTDSTITSVTDNYYRNELLSVLMYQQLTRNLQFECTKRGDFGIDKIDLIAYNVFLTGKSVVQLDCGISLLVFPKLLKTDQFDVTFRNLLGDITTKRHLIEDNFEFRGIRDYQTFDTMKSINWSASAKTGALKVNQFSFTTSQQIKIIFNLENDYVMKLDSIEETIISLAASFANSFLNESIPTSCYCNGFERKSNKVVSIDTGVSDQQLKSILVALARIDLNHDLIDFTKLLDDLLANKTSNEWIILISASINTELQTHVFNTLTDQDSFTWIAPCFKDSVDNILQGNNIIKNIIPYPVDDDE